MFFCPGWPQTTILPFPPPLYPGLQLGPTSPSPRSSIFTCIKYVCCNRLVKVINKAIYVKYLAKYPAYYKESLSKIIVCDLTGCYNRTIKTFLDYIWNFWLWTIWTSIFTLFRFVQGKLLLVANHACLPPILSLHLTLPLLVFLILASVLLMPIWTYILLPSHIILLCPP
jgi:hypothetical protein